MSYSLIKLIDNLTFLYWTATVKTDTQQSAVGHTQTRATSLQPWDVWSLIGDVASLFVLEHCTTTTTASTATSTTVLYMCDNGIYFPVSCKS